MRITLEIKDNKLDTFLKFIKNLDYVSVFKEDIPQWQQKEVVERIEKIEKGQMKTRSWTDAKQDIFKK